MRFRIAVVATLVTLVTAAPVAGYAASPETPSKDATGTYDLEFSLPTAGMSGCQVCHGDPNLAKASADATVSLFVDPEALAESAHAEQACTNCHTDFAFKTPHDNVVNGSDWRSTAKLACKNCKEHEDEFTEYSAGAHSPAGASGAATRTVTASGEPAEVPLCGDCHGGHRIASKEDTAAAQAYHRLGDEICGECHVEAADSYDDYYHGAAYRKGAADAPACWDCHGTHKILPASDPSSMVNEAHLKETCGQPGCHEGEVTDEFLEYAQLIHGRSELMQENPLWAAYDSARESLQQFIGSIRSWFD